MVKHATVDMYFICRRCCRFMQNDASHPLQPETKINNNTLLYL